MKPEPIEAKIIERARRFDASVFLGVGRYRTETFDSLPAARDAGERIAREVNNGRKAMIYAITDEGRAVFVPAAYQPQPKEPAMTTSKTELNGAQISKLTAIMTGGGFKRANSRDAAVARFLKIAAEKGIAEEKARDYLAGPYDMAEHVIREHIEGKPMTIPQVKAARKSKPAAKAEPAPKAVPAAKATEQKPAGKRAEILAAAQAGKLPEPPDFSAATHTRFRKKLEEVIALAKAGDLKGLKAYAINPISSSPKAIDRYRNLAVIALEARAGA
jgi:hypothetical protein